MPSIATTPMWCPTSFGLVCNLGTTMFCSAPNSHQFAPLVSHFSVTPMQGSGCIARNEAFPFVWGHAIISCSIYCSTCALVQIFFFVSSTYTKRMFRIVACYRTLRSGATRRIFNVTNTKVDLKGGVPKTAAPDRTLLPCRLSD